MSNILLITDNKSIIETFYQKLFLLRSSDKMSYCNYEDAPDIVFAQTPEVCIVHELEDFTMTFNLIKYIKTKGCSVLLLLNSYGRDKVLEAYDEGVEDYVTLLADPSEVLIKTVNCIKKRNLLSKIDEYKSCLELFGTISPEYGFYKAEHSCEIGDMLFEKSDFSKGALSVIELPERFLKTYGEKFVSALKTSIRNNDFVGMNSNNRFVVVNCENSTDGALEIFERVQVKLGVDVPLIVGISRISGENFSTVLKKAKCALTEAKLEHKNYMIFESDKALTETDEWLDDMEVEPQKNFKIFKTVFKKKYEQVIGPFFENAQTQYSEALKFSQVEQFTDEKMSVFRIFDDKNSSILRLAYEGLTKVKITIAHAGLNSAENSELSVSIKKITPEFMKEIFEKFIKEYTSTDI